MPKLLPILLKFLSEIPDVVIVFFIVGFGALLVLFPFTIAYYSILFGAGLFCAIYNGMLYLVALGVNFVVQFLLGGLIGLADAIIHGLARLVDMVMAWIYIALTQETPPDTMPLLSSQIPWYAQYIRRLYWDPSPLFIYPHELVGNLQKPQNDVYNVVVLPFFQRLMEFFMGPPPLPGTLGFPLMVRRTSRKAKGVSALLGLVFGAAGGFLLWYSDWYVVFLLFSQMLQMTPQLAMWQASLTGISILLIALAIVALVYKKERKR